MQAARKQMMAKAIAKRRRRAVKTHRRTKPASQPGLGIRVQHLAESAVDTAKTTAKTAVETAKTAINTGKEIATATAKKIKNAVS